MSYELLIRAPAGSGSLDESEIRRRMAAAGGEDGAEAWSIPNRPSSFRAQLWRAEDGRVGLDLSVAVGGSEDEFRRYFEFAQATAIELRGVVFDPQLSREVGSGSIEEVVERWRAMRSYMADIAGQYEDPRGLVEFAPPPQALSPQLKTALLIAGGLALAVWVLDRLLGSLLGNGP